jgi:hypothetical protein
MNESRELKAPRWLRTISQIELKKKKTNKISKHDAGHLFARLWEMSNGSSSAG